VTAAVARQASAMRASFARRRAVDIPSGDKPR
jgi:hypothetical protein